MISPCVKELNTYTYEVSKRLQKNPTIFNSKVLMKGES